MSVNGKVFRKGESLLRVVYVKAPESVYTISLEGYDREMPVRHDYQSFMDDLNNGVYRKAADPFREKAYHATVSQEQKRQADRCYEVINAYWKDPVLKRSLLERQGRSGVISEIARELNISEDSARRRLTRFFRRGMSRNALLPDFDRRGGLQKNGIIKNSTGVGIGMDDKMRENFRKGYHKFYKGTGNTLREAHALLIEAYYPEAYEKKDSRLAPTYDQFYYWIRNNITPYDKDTSRMSETDFENNHNILSAYAVTGVEGIGDCFEMDDAQLDIYLVSSADRSVVVGKPHIFSIVDVYSSLVCGFCLSLQAESWDTASRALNNCVQDKVEFCAEYGIKIEPWQWPCHYLPAELRNDNGKARSHNIEPIAFEYGMSPEYARPYFPVQKSKVERSHRRFNDWIKRRLPGASQSDEGERGADDYAGKACLTLEELTRIIILLILDFNRTPVSKYPVDSDILTLESPPAPIDLWEMSLQNYGGNLIAVEDRELFRQLTLPNVERVVQRGGIQLHNLEYSSSDPEIRSILYNNLGKTVRIFYDILDIRRVYMEMDRKMYPLTLKNPYAFKDMMSLVELEFLIERRNKRSREKEFNRQREHLGTQKEIEEIVREAARKSSVKSSRVNVEERSAEIMRDRISRMEDEPVVREKRPAKNLYSRWDDERRKAMKRMEKEK